MLEQVRYINHLDETLYFGEGDLYVNLNELHDFTWEVVSRNDKIAGFDRGIHKKTFPVRIGALSEEEGIEKRNKLFEIPEKDVLTLTPGKLVINGFYLSCYVTSSKKSYYSIDGKFLSCELTITTDNPMWIKKEAPETGTVSDYVNTNFCDSNFRLEINGGGENPGMVIGGHTYQVVGTVGDASTSIIIDSLASEVYTVDSLGSAVSVFGSRNKENYIFKKIAAGNFDAAFTEDFVQAGTSTYDIYIYIERSEPAWSIDDALIALWTYAMLSNGKVREESEIYTRPTGLDLYLQNGHLIQEKTETSDTLNYFKLENGRLIAYHD